MIDLLFTAHNRLQFVHASFRTLLSNTNWDLVNQVFILDDLSTDGTAEYLHTISKLSHDKPHFVSQKFGGPVAAMNYMLDRSDAEIAAKIDSDVISPPGWLDTMLGVLDENPELDALGMEPGFADRVQPDFVKRTYQPARYIGGVGVFHTRVFAKHRPVQKDKFFGLTAHWRKYATCGWVSPDLPMFLLDHLPGEPWASLAASYVDAGWSRAWPKYGSEFSDYFDWWLAIEPAHRMETAGA